MESSGSPGFDRPGCCFLNLMSFQTSDVTMIGHDRTMVQLGWELLPPLGSASSLIFLNMPQVLHFGPPVGL